MTHWLPDRLSADGRGGGLGDYADDPSVNDNSFT